MFDVRKFRPRTYLHYLFLLLLALSILANAQNKDDKDEGKGKERESKKGEANGGGNFVKVEGKVRCDRPDPVYSIVVPDRPGHALSLTQRKCNWTEPLVIMGGKGDAKTAAKTRDGVAVSFTEKMEGVLHVHGFETDTLDDGEKLTWQSMGQVLAEKGPANTRGRWSLMRGTGKFKGIKGGGTYDGKLDADDVLVLNLEGVYDPSEMVGDKK
jgi:hypothetical protein